MKTRAYLRGVLAGLAFLFVTVSWAGAQVVEELNKRREAVIFRMQPGSCLVLRSSTTRRGGDAVPNPNFYYLAGLTEPGECLVLLAGGEDRKEDQAVLFIRPEKSPRTKKAQSTLSMEDVKTLSGIPEVLHASKIEAYLDKLFQSGPIAVYMDTRRSRGGEGESTVEGKLVEKAQKKDAKIIVKQATGLIDPLRRIKSPHEIGLLRKAIDITCEAHKEVMRSAKPGMYEHQLQSIIEHVFTTNGAPETGFSSIVGSGPNGCILHWEKNTRKTKKGELVVMDVGAEYEGYSADVTRTIPINGKFSKRHRKVYEIVLEANEAAIAMVAPGVDSRSISNRVDEIIAKGLKELGLIENEMDFRKYYYHGMSHPIGLQVHDVGGLGILEPGMVITIEPGIYVREQDFGIRIEDDVLVTEKGYEELSKSAPKTVEAIEAMMAEKGMNLKQVEFKKKR
jgi:Xaa-Pro aminopeptidase